MNLKYVVYKCFLLAALNFAWFGQRRIKSEVDSEKMYSEYCHRERSTMKYTNYLSILLLLASSQHIFGIDTLSQPTPTLPLVIHSNNDDMEAAHTNIKEENIPKALKQYKDVERYNHDELSNAIKQGNSSEISPVSTMYPTSISFFTSPVTTQVQQIPTEQDNVFKTNDDKTQLKGQVIPKPTLNVRRLKKATRKPMFYKIIKKVEYGPKKIQRRYGFGNDHKFVLRPVSQHNVRFYIKPKNINASNGGKVFIPITPKPHQQITKWVTKEAADVLKSPTNVPNYKFFGAYKGFEPLQSVSITNKIPNFTVPKNMLQFGKQQYQHYSQGPSQNQYSQVENFDGNIKTEQNLPNWLQGVEHPSFNGKEVTHENSEWGPQDISYESEPNGFSSFVSSQFNPEQFSDVPLSHTITGDLSKEVAFREHYYPKVNLGTHKLHTQYQQNLQPQSFEETPIRHYAVEEQSFDVPPPHNLFVGRPMGPASKPLGHVLGTRPSRPYMQQPSIMMQFQSQGQYIKNQQGQPNIQKSISGAEFPVGGIDYSAYQPEPVKIAPAAAHNHNQQNYAIQTAPEKYLKHYPSQSPIQDFSPNYLREITEEYKYPEVGIEQDQGVTWVYQGSQWEQQNNGQHPSLQASYEWKQKTQDGKIVDVKQEAVNDVSRVISEPTHAHHSQRPANHSPIHHEIVKKQVKPVTALQVVINDHEDKASEEIITEASFKKQPVPAPSIQKDSMISNGWTPIINN